MHSLKDIEAILDAFAAHGHTELDTSRVYGAGTSEELLGQIDLAGKGLQVQTKLYPTAQQIRKLGSQFFHVFSYDACVSCALKS